jgi:ComF family protein
LCDRLGIPLTWGHGERVISALASAHPPIYDRARAVAHFDSVPRQLVHAFKYGDRHDPRRLFGRWLVVAGHELLADADLIIPVPLHRWRLLSRRYNQSAILAQEVSKLTGVDWRPDVLARVKATRQQVGLTEAERQTNVAGALRVPSGRAHQVQGRRVLLIDDVITTGATISACARALRRAGAAHVDVLAVAMVTEDSRIGL